MMTSGKRSKPIRSRGSWLGPAPKIAQDPRKRPTKISKTEAKKISAETNARGYATRVWCEIGGIYYETTGCTFRVVHDFMQSKYEAEKKKKDQGTLF